MGFPGGARVKNLLVNTGDIRDVGLIPGLGRSPEGRHGNQLQFSFLENPMDRRAWRVIVHRVTKSWTRLSGFHFTPYQIYIYIYIYIYIL